MADKIVSWGGIDSKGTTGLSITGSTSFYSTQDNGFVAIVSGSRSSSDIAFNFQKIGEPSVGSRHTMLVQGTGGNDTNLYFGVNQVSSNLGAIFAVKGNGSVNINMPSPTGNYGGLAVGGWISSYPSLLVRGYGATSSTTALLVQNANTSASLSVLDDGSVGIGTASPFSTGLTVANPAYTGYGRMYMSANTTFVIADNGTGGNITFGPSNRIFINSPQVSLPSGYISIGGSAIISTSGSYQGTTFTLGNFIAANIGSSTGLTIKSTYTQQGAGGPNTGTVVRITDSRIDTIAGVTNTLTMLTIDPLVNTTGGTTTLRGFYYNPTISSSVGLTQHTAIETTTGDVIFGSTSGNVGIRTTTPTATLHVSGSGRFNGDLVMSGSTQNRSVKLTDSGLYLSRTSDGTYVSTITADGTVYFNTRNSYVFNNDGTTTIQFQSDTRNVLIGTTSDLARLAVRGSGTTTSTTTFLLQNSSNTQLGYVDDSGRWMIGSGTNGGFTLDVGGTTQISSTSGGYKLTVKTTGGGNGAGLLVDQNGYTMLDVNAFDVYMRNYPSSTAKLDFWCWNNYGGPTNVLFAQNSQYHVSLNSPDNYKIPIVKFPDATVPIIMGNIATSAIRGYLTVGGAFYASASLGASQRIVSTVSAIANNDTLVGLDIQPTFANGAYTGVNNYALRVSGSTSLYKSGSTVLDIQGSSGQLFSVTDSLSGSLFSVNTVAGLPVIEAFSNNVVNIGKYGSYGLVVSGSAVTVATGSSAPTGTAAEGTFKFAVVGGSYYIYVYLGGAWRSGSLS